MLVSVNADLVQRFLSNLSIQTIELLLRYPDWRSRVLNAYLLPPLPFGFEPTLVEAFDQQGLLAGRINDYVYAVELPLSHRCEFIAWYFDSELVLFSVGAELAIDRLQLVGVAGLFDLAGSR
jgi:hypothetical protein